MTDVRPRPGPASSKSKKMLSPRYEGGASDESEESDVQPLPVQVDPSALAPTVRTTTLPPPKRGKTVVGPSVRAQRERAKRDEETAKDAETEAIPAPSSTGPEEEGDDALTYSGAIPTRTRALPNGYDFRRNRATRFLTILAGKLTLERIDLYQPNFDEDEYDHADSQRALESPNLDVFDFISLNCKSQVVSAMEEAWDYIQQWDVKHKWCVEFTSLSEMLADEEGLVVFAFLVFSVMVHNNFFSHAGVYTRMSLAEKTKLRLDAFGRTSDFFTKPRRRG